MREFFDLKQLVAWIEVHPNSVDLLKWALVAVAAWFLGFFKFVRRKLRSPRVEIEQLTSRCYCEHLDELHGSKNVTRTIFLVQVSVTNPTTDPIVVKDFWLRYRTLRPFKRWTEFMLPTTFPNRPRQKVGSSTKLLQVWFSHFENDSAEAVLSGHVGPRDYQVGYLLFVSATWGNHNPSLQNDTLSLEIQAKLTSGETLKHRSVVSQIKDRAYLEEFVPEILSVGRNVNAQNLFKSRA